MNPTSLHEIANRCGAKLIRGNGEVAASGVTQDTRRLEPGDLYVALCGEKQDGHQFVKEAARRGAAGAMVTKGIAYDAPPDFALLEVEDSLSGLHHLAASWRDGLAAKVIVLTGSSGKTSTKELLAAVLAQAGSVSATRGNFNNHIGLPLSILRANREDRFVVWEIGMNHPGEIASLAELARPDVAVITSIGTAHIEFFADRKGIALEKAALFSALPPSGPAIYPEVDDYADVLGRVAGKRARPVGFKSGDPHAENIQPTHDGISFTLVAKDEQHPVTLAYPGEHMIQNALLAAATGMALGVAPGKIAAGLSSVQPAAGRLEKKEIRGLLILDDTYNANPDSMVAALQTLGTWPLQESAKRIAVLGRMGELGSHAEEGYRKVGTAAAKLVDLLLTVGPDTKPMADAARAAGLKEVFSPDDKAAAATILRSVARSGDLVLLKGSRATQMEEILQLLN